MVDGSNLQKNMNMFHRRGLNLKGKMVKNHETTPGISFPWTSRLHSWHRCGASASGRARASPCRLLRGAPCLASAPLGFGVNLPPSDRETAAFVESLPETKTRNQTRGCHEKSRRISRKTRFVCVPAAVPHPQSASDSTPAFEVSCPNGSLPQRAIQVSVVSVASTTAAASPVSRRPTLSVRHVFTRPGQGKRHSSDRSKALAKRNREEHHVVNMVNINI